MPWLSKARSKSGASSSCAPSSKSSTWKLRLVFIFYALLCHFDYIFASCLFGERERGSEGDRRVKEIKEKEGDMRGRATAHKQSVCLVAS